MEFWMVLEEEGDQDTSFEWIVRECGAVPSVVCDGAGHEIGKGEQGEGPAGLGPCEDGPAHPFDDLTQVVGIRDIAEPSTVGDGVPRAICGITSAAAQGADDGIRGDVQCQSASEHAQSQQRRQRRTASAGAGSSYEHHAVTGGR